MVRLSIIVPVFNTEKYLRQCIESILEQKFQDFELILINDGSTDSSGTICDEYSKKNKRIIVRHKENQGQSSARNLGLDLASGDYIGFVDSDDYIHEGMYELLVEHAESHHSDIAACNFWIMDKNGVYSPYKSSALDKEYSRLEAISELYTNKILSFSPCNKIYRRSLFSNLRFIEGKILEDKAISYQLVNQADRVSYLSKSLYYYRYNENSTLRKAFSLNRVDEYQIQMDMYDFYRVHYPELSDLVYYGVFDFGNYLYGQILMLKNRSYEEKYKYLIQFDRVILKRLISRPEIPASSKLKLFLGLYFPKAGMSVRLAQNKLRELRNKR